MKRVGLAILLTICLATGCKPTRWPTWFGEEFDPHGRFDPNIPAGEAYDGLVLFLEVTPER